MSYVIVGAICFLAGAAVVWIYKSRIIKAAEEARAEIGSKIKGE